MWRVRRTDIDVMRLHYGRSARRDRLPCLNDERRDPFPVSQSRALKAFQVLDDGASQGGGIDVGHKKVSFQREEVRLRNGSAINSRSVLAFSLPSAGRAGEDQVRSVILNPPPSLTLPAEGREQAGISGSDCAPVPELCQPDFLPGEAH